MRNELFRRYKRNPILTPKMWQYPVLSVINPAAVKIQDEILLLVRVEDMSGYSHLTIVRSEDGKTNWQIDSEPTLKANISFGEFKYGLEDPRVVWIKERKEYIIICVSFRHKVTDEPPGISLISTKDFSSFERVSQPLIPPNKDACLFPETFEGSYALIHRPIVDGRADIWVSFSPDLHSWEDDRILLSARRRIWDSERIGLACPPIKTREGWLIFYHGTRGGIYRIGLALLHLEKLELIRRSEGCILAPEELYERVGNKPNVVFPCGHILDKDKLSIYYGAADSTVCLATASLEEILDYLMKCPEK